jgi:co-chaperonin GroES (HSP10)
MMVQAPQNNLLVKIGDVFLKRVSAIVKVTAAHAKNTKMNPADLVQIIGTVVSVPRGCKDRAGIVGYTAKDVRVGDAVVFRYDVVYDFDIKHQKWRNVFYYKGQEYWVCDIVKAFFVIRNEEIIMLNGYCMVENIAEPPKILLPGHLRNISQIGSAVLTHIGEPLEGAKPINAKVADTVYFVPKRVQRYEIRGKPFGIIRQQDIMGAKIAEYSELI